MRICLIGATHVSQSPRLLREADSLSEAGHDVRVIARSYIPVLTMQDTRTWHAASGHTSHSGTQADSGDALVNESIENHAADLVEAV